MREMCHKLLTHLGCSDDPILELAMELERVALQGAIRRHPGRIGSDPAPGAGGKPEAPALHSVPPPSCLPARAAAVTRLNSAGCCL